jgi:hypothetical protein
MWRSVAFGLVGLVTNVAHAGSTIRCDDVSTADLVVDGMLDDWKQNQVLSRTPAIAMRCSWDGKALGFAFELGDDRVVRVRGKGHEDHVDIALSAGGKAAAIAVYPGNPVAKPKVSAPAHVAVADSLQPKGFSIELRVPASAIPNLSTATSSVELHVIFHDSDAAVGGADTDIALDATIELGDRKDLLDDFLKTAKLGRSDVKLDTLAELDPDRRGKERLVAGGTVIGVLTDKFAFVTLPVTAASDVRSIDLLALGARGQQIISAVVRQTGNGGSRDLLMLWTVWTGQLQPLAQIEVRKQIGANVLESTWTLGKGKKAPELTVAPKPAVGWTPAAWNEAPADDADPILLPWDDTKAGIVYTLRGAEVERRDVPPPKAKKTKRK